MEANIQQFLGIITANYLNYSFQLLAQLFEYSNNPNIRGNTAL